MAGWNGRLRQSRREAALELPQLAAAAQISVHTLKSYESGRRRPSRERLRRILDALGAGTRVRNEVLAAAGYVPETPPTNGIDAARSLTVAEAAAAVEARPWPAFVIGGVIDVLAMNGLAFELWGINRARLRDPVRRSVLSMITEPRFAERCLNWEQAVAGVISFAKASERGTRSLESARGLISGVLDETFGGDARLVRRFIEIWEATPPATEPKVSIAYEVGWQHPVVGAMRFYCLANTVNEAEAIDIDDWHPADPASHEALARLAGLCATTG